MDDDKLSEPSNAQNGFDSPGLGRGFKRERGLSKALSVLRASTKLQPQRRGSSSHMRIVEEEDGFVEVEEDNTSVDDFARPRTGSGAASLSRNLSRQRTGGVVTAVEGQRRNAPRGEWSPAEEAVLARKHMELGNKWTTISHFLPARSDNDVKNIWHSTLRSKNSERRSFLRTYARAVRDCANDAEARKQAYEMAQRVCGPHQPIEQALAAVQQQYQQQLAMQAMQQEEEGEEEEEGVLGEGDSPEYQPECNTTDRDTAGLDGCGERDMEVPAPCAAPHPVPAPVPGPTNSQGVASAAQQQQQMQHQGTGACSRTNSALDSHQHQQHQQPNGTRGGAYPRFALSGAPEAGAASGPCVSTSPFETLDAAAAAGGGFLGYPAQVQAQAQMQAQAQACGSLTLQRDSSHSLGLSAGHPLLNHQHPQQHQDQQHQQNQQQHQQQQHQQRHGEDGPQQHPQQAPAGAGVATSREVDSSCLARFSALHLADQMMHRQQQQQQQQLLQQQQQQMLQQQQQQMLQQQQQHMMALSTSSTSGQQGRSQLPASGPSMPMPTQQQRHGYGARCRDNADDGTGAAPADAEAAPYGVPLSGVDIDDMLALGLDLTPEELAMLGPQSGRAGGGQQQQQQGPAGVAAGGPQPGGHAAAAVAPQPHTHSHTHSHSNKDMSRVLQHHQPQQHQQGQSLEQQQQQMMTMLRGDSLQRQPGSGSGLLDGSGAPPNGGCPRGPPSGPAPLPAGERPLPQHPQQQPQPDAFDSLLAELELRNRLRVVTHSHLHMGGSHSLQLPELQGGGGVASSQQQQQHDDVLGLQLGSPYAYQRCYQPYTSLDMHSLGSAARCGLVAPHNTIAELQSLASCASTTIELLASGQQAHVDGSLRPHHPYPQPHPGGHQQHQQQTPAVVRRGSALGMFGTGGAYPGGGNDSFSNASSGLLSPLGIGSTQPTLNGHNQQPQLQRAVAGGGGIAQYPLPGGGGAGGAAAAPGGGVWQASACGGNSAPGGGGGGWGAGLLRQGGGGTTRTLSSPVTFCVDAGTGGAGGDAAASAAVATQPGGAGGGGPGSGLMGRGSGLVPSMSSLAVPAQVDVVTMGLDSGDLLDCMDCCEGEPAPEAGSGLVAEETLELTLRASARAVVQQQRQQLQLQAQMAAGGRGMMMQGGGGIGAATAAAAQQCWPAVKAPQYNAGRIGPLLRL